MIYSVYEGVDNCWHIQFSQVWILLAHTHENNGFPCRVHHVDCSAHFGVHSVELGHNDAVDCARILHIDRKVDQRLVKLGQLVNRVVSNQSFTHKKHHLWLINVNKFGKLAHKSFVALHAPCRINQHHINALISSLSQGFFCNLARIIPIAFLVEGDAQDVRVRF